MCNWKRDPVVTYYISNKSHVPLVLFQVFLVCRFSICGQNLSSTAINHLITISCRTRQRSKAIAHAVFLPFSSHSKIKCDFIFLPYYQFGRTMGISSLKVSTANKSLFYLMWRTLYKGKQGNITTKRYPDRIYFISEVIYHISNSLHNCLRGNIPNCQIAFELELCA